MDINDYVLIDNSTGVLLGSDTAVAVPAVYGDAAYALGYDDDAAIEYGLGQGLLLLPPGADGEPVDSSFGREYLVIDTDNGYTGDLADVRAVPEADAGDLDELAADPNAAIQLASTEGQVPVVPTEITELPGLQYDPVL